MKYALVTGISGMDGSRIAEFLLEKEYKVYGIIRRASMFNLSRLDGARSNKNLKLVYGDMTDSSSLTKTLMMIKKEMGESVLEIYNLAAQSHVGISFQVPEYTADATGFGVLKILEAIRNCELEMKVKFYQASTSEMFGGEPGTEPQCETTPFKPKSPYACAKLYAHWIVDNYRSSYGIFACCGILFNHSDSRRGENFILRKISIETSKIIRGETECMYLGNLDAKRDIGASQDYIKGMWMMLQHDKPDDYVLATGKQYTIREFVEMAFDYFSVDIEWRGEGMKEVGIAKNTGEVVVRVSEKYFRPNEVHSLVGDYSKAKKQLGWEPTTSLKELIGQMIENDFKKN